MYINAQFSPTTHTTHTPHPKDSPIHSNQPPQNHQPPGMCRAPTRNRARGRRPCSTPRCSRPWWSSCPSGKILLINALTRSGTHCLAGGNRIKGKGNVGLFCAPQTNKLTNPTQNRWRFMQCLRRYHDTGNRWPHLFNAAKYALAQVR